MKILVALSGGVDSSTAAYLLREQGHELVGAQFILWSDPLSPAVDQHMTKECCNAQTMARAKHIAEDLGIPFHRIDLADEFKKLVVDPFLDEYRQGLTPNPCVRCNRNLKTAVLLRLADKYGCEKIATGHYAQVSFDTSSQRWCLEEAVDTAKDQSYFLSQLTQEQLSRCLFPLGSLYKKDVIKRARSYGIPLPADYQQSQDLCFFPEQEPHAFLDRYIAASPGEIVDTKGKPYGQHSGLHHYTEGQRRGLKIGGLKIPLHVVRKDTEANRLIVGTGEEAMRSELRADRMNWVSEELEECKEYLLEARIHSLGRRTPCSVRQDEKFLICTFDSPQSGVSPGQVLVLYKGNKIIGSGFIIFHSSDVSTN